jgi:uncharacterized membrane protein YuzA (DUF378 family)
MTRFVLTLTYLAAIAVGIYGGFQVFDIVTK